MQEQNLTKKEKYDIDKRKKAEELISVQKKKKTKRILMWFLVAVAISASVFGLIKLSAGPPDNQSAAIIDAISSSDWIKGNKEAKTILIEYSDFQCPACAVYHPIVKKLIEEHGDSFQFAYRHFPLDQHKNAEAAAYAAEAAGKQGKFWEIHDMIFEHQDDWSEAENAKDIFKEYAQSLNLNIEQFNQDRDSKVVKDKVQNDYTSGLANKVNGTPTFFLNNRKVQPRNYEEFVNFINE
jgi:protein-disulfide isomerase